MPLRPAVALLVVLLGAAPAQAASRDTALVSRAGGPAGAKGDNTSSFASTSANGRFVAFQSTAANLSADDLDFNYDIFVRDMQSGTTTLVSRASGIAGLPARARRAVAPGSRLRSVKPVGRRIAQEPVKRLRPGGRDSIHRRFRFCGLGDVRLAILVYRVAGAGVAMMAEVGLLAGQAQSLGGPGLSP
jgi:hypothetical protein